MSREDQVQKGLSAAALAPRARAGLIDALFILGCFLIFVLIVFFVPEFALFTRSSMLGMGSVLLLIFLSYIGTFTTLGARTLGMDHEHLEVVSYQGNPITVQEARLRSFGYLVSLGCFGLGFLWALFDPEQLTWHDKISRTLVVRKPGNADPN
ncbi:MAG TPA: RDD family protein [Terriglobia bacterium]|nr:RDD family protein [Terriglobia bacterium]